MPRADRARGFTLIEAVVVLALVAVLAAIAYPGYRAQLMKARRADALIALMQLQQAQERWRSSNLRYGSAQELAAPATTPNGHYRVAVESASDVDFELVATAVGPQQDDTACRVLRISHRRGDTQYRASPHPAFGGLDDSDAHRQCWAR